MQNGLVKYLTTALQKELPGIKAHQKMVPPGRILIPPQDEYKKIKHSGILFLLFPLKNRLFTCLIKRPTNMKHHPGQVGFPGGQVEKNDISLQMTATREAEEEIGITTNSYKIIGKLSDLYIQVSNFFIHPYIAWTDKKPEFRINKLEVEDIIMFPVQDFMENEKLDRIEIETSIGKLNVPYYPLNGEIIWGATAMILSEFFELTRYYQPVRE